MTNQDNERKLTEDERNAGLRVSDVRGPHVLPHLRSVDSERSSPPCNRCSFYYGAAKCAFYSEGIPAAFLIETQRCGRYVKQSQGATD